MAATLAVRRQEPGDRQGRHGRGQGARRPRRDGDGRAVRRFGQVAVRDRTASQERRRAAASSPCRRASSASPWSRRRSTMPATASGRSGRLPLISNALGGNPYARSSEIAVLRQSCPGGRFVRQGRPSSLLHADARQTCHAPVRECGDRVRRRRAGGHDGSRAGPHRRGHARQRRSDHRRDHPARARSTRVQDRRRRHAVSGVGQAQQSRRRASVRSGHHRWALVSRHAGAHARPLDWRDRPLRD